MSEAVEQVLGATLLADCHAAVDTLLGADLTRASDQELLEGWRELERLRRRLAAVEHRLVLEAESRSLPQTFRRPEHSRLPAPDAAPRSSGSRRTGPRRRSGRRPARDVR
jgi:hypothetical protein